MISSVSLSDIEEFNELGLLVNKNFLNVFNLKEILNSSLDFIYGYYEDDELIGFIHVNVLYETMDLVNIVVSEKYRNKGIGSELLNYVIQQHDISNIMLEVNENNENAINFYLDNGFQIINKRKKYYGEDDALIMKRDV